MLLEFVVIVVSINIIFILFQFILSYISKSKEVKTESEIHLIRRIQHTGTGLIALFFLYFATHTIHFYASLLGTIFVFAVTVLRHYNKDFNEKFIQKFKFLLRQHEIDNLQFPGAFYFLLGIFIVVSQFEAELIGLAITVLSFGDPFASLIGITIKSKQIMPGKSLYGTIGGGIVAGTMCLCTKLTLISSLYKENAQYIEGYEQNNIGQQINQMGNIQFLILAIIISTLAELGPSSRKHHLDDNLTIPIYTALGFKLYFSM